jgi:hypothetical protein
MDKNNLDNNLHDSNDAKGHELSILNDNELMDDAVYERHIKSGMSHSAYGGDRLFSVVLPLFVALFLMVGLVDGPGTGGNSNYKTEGFHEPGADDTSSKMSKLGLMSVSDLKKPIMDTVYTDKDVWFELRVDEQHVYQHWRDGRTVRFPVSSGNKFISKSVEARPGIFAIFYRNEHHKSSQFDDASLYHFQTFNQGIGFHSLNGTGYYGNLGVRPSSHGCIRMSHKDAEQMYRDAEMGTLVLVHYSGKHARTVGFAPKGYKGREYTQEEQKRMLAENLLNVLNGNYFTAEREFFVVDPKVIPMSGIYVGYDKKLPKVQKMPVASYYFKMNPDVLKMRDNYETYWEEKDAEGDFQLVAASNTSEGNQLSVSSDDELVKKYFHNPIGILPYYPPSKPKTNTTYVSSNSSDDGSSSDSGSDEGSEEIYEDE